MSAFIAALPMYDWPETRGETDALWARLRDALRSAGIDAPEGLLRRNGDFPPVPGGIRDAEGTVIAPDPATLPPDEFDVHVLWRHPALLLAQTCWGPMELGLRDHVSVVGQPDYSDVEGGEGPLYSSVVLMRDFGAAERVAGGVTAGRGTPLWPAGHLPLKGGDSPARPVSPIVDAENGAPRPELPISPREGEMAGRPEGGHLSPAALSPAVPSPPDGSAFLPLERLRGARLAYNGPDSMSGIIALTRDLAALGEDVDTLFAERLETGSHRASLRAVAAGEADACAIDCRSWALARRFEPASAELEIVGWTARRKGLPYITARATPPETVAILRKILAWSEELDSLFEENAAILQKFASDGKDLTSPRTVDFFHIFPDEISAEAFAQTANALGYAIVVDEVERKINPWDVTASKEMAPTCEAITDTEERLGRLAQSHRGRADGWGFVNV